MAEPDVGSDPFHLCGLTIEGKYRIASVIGDGGFSVVYRAVHKGFGELVAVKCLKLPTSLDATQRDELLETLRSEGRILHRLSRATSGIVQALDVGTFTTDSGMWVPYLVLEWLEGQTLAGFLRDRSERGEGGLPVAEAVRLLEPAARALGVAHSQKIAHRDVKPANLFLTQVGSNRTLKVLDFGIAKVLADYPTFTEALAATQQGPTVFTPRYGAPEQFNKARGATGPWTDVFALALILVELVSGKRALEGDDPTQLYIASSDPSMRPTLRGRGFDPGEDVERVLNKALAIEPKHRYATADEFWNALVAATSATANPPTQSPQRQGTSDVNEMLNTADFASEKRLDVVSEPPRVAKSDPTMPIESMGEAAKPVLVKVSQHAGQTKANVSSAKANSLDDSMAETPAGRRPLGSSSDASAAAKPQVLPQSDKLQASEQPSGKRGIWLWVVVAFVVGGGALFAVFGLPPLTSSPSTGPSSKRLGVHKSAKVRSLPTGAQASTTVSSTASAEVPAEDAAVPPPPPPEDMVYIAPQTATIGAGQDERQVTLSRGFYIDRNEVTVRAYQACMAQRACSTADHVSITPEQPADGEASAPSARDSEFAALWSPRCNERRKALDHPINCVDYANAEGYCRFRGRRLPTEAEWEIAARGADGRLYAWGTGAPTCDHACFNKNGECRARHEEVATCSSGSHPSDRTPEGIYDLAGNVAEWVSDGLVSPPPGGVDPRGDPTAALKVVRGGSFFDGADKLVATARAGVAPATAHVTIGFRCAMDVP